MMALIIDTCVPYETYFVTAHKLSCELTAGGDLRFGELVPLSPRASGMTNTRWVAQVACANKMGLGNIDQLFGLGPSSPSLKVARASVAAGPFCQAATVDAWRESRLSRASVTPLA
jgi:hypothetical protein